MASQTIPDENEDDILNADFVSTTDLSGHEEMDEADILGHLEETSAVTSCNTKSTRTSTTTTITSSSSTDLTESKTESPFMDPKSDKHSIIVQPKKTDIITTSINEIDIVQKPEQLVAKNDCSKMNPLFIRMQNEKSRMHCSKLDEISTTSKDAVQNVEDRVSDDERVGIEIDNVNTDVNTDVNMDANMNATNDVNMDANKDKKTANLTDKEELDYDEDEDSDEEEFPDEKRYKFRSERPAATVLTRILDGTGRNRVIPESLDDVQLKPEFYTGTRGGRGRGGAANFTVRQKVLINPQYRGSVPQQPNIQLRWDSSRMPVIRLGAVQVVPPRPIIPTAVNVGMMHQQLGLMQTRGLFAAPPPAFGTVRMPFFGQSQAGPYSRPPPPIFANATSLTVTNATLRPRSVSDYGNWQRQVEAFVERTSLQQQARRVAGSSPRRYTSSTRRRSRSGSPSVSPPPPPRSSRRSPMSPARQPSARDARMTSAPRRRPPSPPGDSEFDRDSKRKAKELERARAVGLDDGYLIKMEEQKRLRDETLRRKRERRLQEQQMKTNQSSDASAAKEIQSSSVSSSERQQQKKREQIESRQQQQSTNESRTNQSTTNESRARKRVPISADISDSTRESRDYSRKRMVAGSNDRSTNQRPRAPMSERIGLHTAPKIVRTSKKQSPDRRLDERKSSESSLLRTIVNNNNNNNIGAKMVGVVKKSVAANDSENSGNKKRHQPVIKNDQQKQLIIKGQQQQQQRISTNERFSRKRPEIDRTGSMDGQKKSAPAADKKKMMTAAVVAGICRWAAALGRLTLVAGTVGPVTKCWKSSDDTVTIVFDKAEDTVKFAQQYNGKMLSGVQLSVKVNTVSSETR